MSGNILVIGSSNTDMIIKCKNIPQPGETILSGEFKMAPGGKGANQAVAAARAGGKVTFFAKVGNDLFGHQAEEGFIKDNINTDYILRDTEKPSGIALIFVDEKGENSIGVASGANFNLFPDDIMKNKKAFSNISILLMQLEIPLQTVRKAAEFARESGIKIILNPAPAQFLDSELIKNINILTPNKTEAEILTHMKINNANDIEKASQTLLQNGSECVIITLGPDGLYFQDSQKAPRWLGTRSRCKESQDFLEAPRLRLSCKGSGQVPFRARVEILKKALLSKDYGNKGFSAVFSEGFFIPSFSVNAVDSTAAGDVFNGALAVALSEGKDIIDSIKFASAAAALSVTKFGAQPSIPFRNEIEAFLKNQP